MKRFQLVTTALLNLSCPSPWTNAARRSSCRSVRRLWDRAVVDIFDACQDDGCIRSQEDRGVLPRAQRLSAYSLIPYLDRDRDMTFELKAVKSYEGSFHAVLIKLHVESVGFRSNIIPVCSVTGRDNVHWMKVQENENNITVIATDRCATSLLDIHWTCDGMSRCAPRHEVGPGEVFRYGMGVSALASSRIIKAKQGPIDDAETPQARPTSEEEVQHLTPEELKARAAAKGMRVNQRGINVSMNLDPPEGWCVCNRDFVEMDVGEGNMKRYSQFIFFEAKKYPQCLGKELLDFSVLLSHCSNGVQQCVKDL
eukprot:361084-Hanusia_phi.AAC.3